MLHEFNDIVVDDWPSEFPPKRSINHHIHLILGASLPKKVAYQMTHKENEEIRRYVQELLEKGLIREILSRCVVPTVLSPKMDGEWTSRRQLSRPTMGCMNGWLCHLD